MPVLSDSLYSLVIIIIILVKNSVLILVLSLYNPTKISRCAFT